MWNNQIFSLIDVDNVVRNIIVCDNYEVANQISRVYLGENAYALDTTLYPLSIGCVYRDGNFYSPSYTDEFGEYHEEALIERNKTEAEAIELLRLENSVLRMERAEADAETDFRLSMIELGFI